MKEITVHARLESDDQQKLDTCEITVENKGFDTYGTLLTFLTALFNSLVRHSKEREMITTIWLKAVNHPAVDRLGAKNIPEQK